MHTAPLPDLRRDPRPDLRRQPTLVGPRLRVRPVEDNDWQALYAIAQDPLLWAQHPERERYQEPVFRAFFREALDCGGGLVVLEADSGRVVGSSRFVWDDEPAGILEIGWSFLARELWGTGRNTELKRLMLDHAFTFAQRVRFYVGPENWRSRGAMTKLGAQDLGLGLNPAGQPSQVFEFDAAGWGQVRA